MCVCALKLQTEVQTKAISPFRSLMGSYLFYTTVTLCSCSSQIPPQHLAAVGILTDANRGNNLSISHWFHYWYVFVSTDGLDGFLVMSLSAKMQLWTHVAPNSDLHWDLCHISVLSYLVVSFLHQNNLQKHILLITNVQPLKTGSSDNKYIKTLKGSVQGFHQQDTNSLE